MNKIRKEKKGGLVLGVWGWVIMVVVGPKKKQKRKMSQKNENPQTTTKRTLQPK